MTRLEPRDIGRSERPNACCREKDNMTCHQAGEGAFIETCVCGRRHHILEVEAGEIGITGGRI